MADPSVVAQGGGASGDMVREVPDDATIGTEKVGTAGGGIDVHDVLRDLV